MAEEKIWMCGEYLDKSKGTINISTSALHYGTSIFEGILCIMTGGKNRSAIFRLYDHLERMFASAQVLNYKLPYSKEELGKAIINLIKINRFNSCYIRPIVFEDVDYLDFGRKKHNLNVVIMCKNFNHILYRWQMRKPSKVIISKNVTNSWPDILIKAKISGKYLNSIVAKRQAQDNGFNDAIILDSSGYVSEATSSNIFMVKDGVIKTPYRQHTLNGITQNSVIRIALDLGYSVSEENIKVSELLEADEVFLTNTALGIISVAQIDSRRIPVGSQKSPVKYLRSKYINIITGKDPKYPEWINYI